MITFLSVKCIMIFSKDNKNFNYAIIGRVYLLEFVIIVFQYIPRKFANLRVCLSQVTVNVSVILLLADSRLPVQQPKT